MRIWVLVSKVSAMADEDHGSGFFDFVRDFSFYTIAGLMSVIVGIVSLVIFTREFSTSAYGQYSLVMAFVTILSTAFYGWIEQGILRFDSGSKDISATVIQLSLVISFLLLLIAVVTQAIFGQNLSEYTRYYFAAALGVVGLGLFNLSKTFFQARLESRFVTLSEFLMATIKLVVGLTLTLFVLDNLVGWIWGLAIGGIITATAIILKVDTDIVGFDSQVATKLFSYGLPMVGWLFGLSLLTYIDRLLLEVLANPSLVGIYSSNYGIVQSGLPLLLSPVINAAHPVIMNAWNNSGSDNVVDLVSKYSRYYLLIGVPATILTGILSKPLSTILLGSGFHSGYSIIPVIAAAIFVWNFAMIGHKGLELKKDTEYMLLGIVLAVASNVVLNILLIPQYGALGASLATLFSSLSYAGFAYLMSFRTVRWRVPNSSIFEIGISASLMAGTGIVVYQISMPLMMTFIGAGIATLVYTVVLYLTGGLRPEEIEMIQSYLPI